MILILNFFFPVGQGLLLSHLKKLETAIMIVGEVGGEVKCLCLEVFTLRMMSGQGSKVRVKLVMSGHQS